MDDFNYKLAQEKNSQITGGVNVGLEYSPFEVTVPDVLPLISGTNVRLPGIGLEYIHSGSKTTHTDIANNTVTTVNWELPVVGIYLAPELGFFSERSLHFSFRPVGLGYYSLGEVLDANLTVSDRQGKLEVTARNVGIKSQIGLSYVKKTWELFFTAGYRWLEFSNVNLTPKDGFATDSHSSNLPENIDYSGMILNGGVKIHL